MALATLLAGDCARYQRECTDQPDALWVFQHIPKTAGSSLAQELRQILRPAANVHADHANPARSAMDTLEEALRTVVMELPTRRYRLIHGHLRGPQIQQIRQKQPLLRALTVLRDPVARMVSDFRYMRTPAHPSYRQVIAQYPRFEDYLADPRSHDKMFRFLRRNPATTLEQTITDLERRFVLVGTLEQYALFGRILFRLLGRQQAPQVHARRTEALAENQIENLDALRPQILQCNLLDQALHAHFSARLDAVSARIGEWLGPPASAAS